MPYARLVFGSLLVFLLVVACSSRQESLYSRLQALTRQGKEALPELERLIQEFAQNDENHKGAAFNLALATACRWSLASGKPTKAAKYCAWLAKRLGSLPEPTVDKREYAQMLRAAADILLEQENLSEAEELLLYNDKILERAWRKGEYVSQLEWAETERLRGLVLWKAGRLTAARYAIESARRRAWKLRSSAPALYQRLSDEYERLLVDMGKFADALAVLDEMISYARAGKNTALLLRALLEAARVRQIQGKTKSAIKRLEEAQLVCEDLVPSFTSSRIRKLCLKVWQQSSKVYAELENEAKAEAANRKAQMWKSSNPQKGGKP